jgi:small ligand-binding sensory domain FIST
MSAFAFAHAAGGNWRECVERCADRLGRPGAGLGFVYFSDALVDFSGEILAVLRERTGVSDWVGTVGTGIVATGTEYQDEPAVAAMIADLDSSSFGIFSGKIPVKKEAAHFAVVHADPQAPDVPGLVADMSAKVASGYVVGGISSSRTRNVQVANDVVSGGLSGVALASQVAVATRLTQGCSPFGPRYRVTACEENVIATLDGKPALEVLLGVADEKQIRAGKILAGLPVRGSDTGDYVVRNLVGIDPRAKLVAIGEAVEIGDEIVFCRRDAAAAREDLGRMLASIKQAAPRPRGALYFSCVARGEHMFGSRGAELGLVRQALGDVPLVGFFCNGEICHDRLYGYTGVLSVFL